MTRLWQQTHTQSQGSHASLLLVPDKMGGWRQERASCVKSANQQARTSAVVTSWEIREQLLSIACLHVSIIIIQRNEGELKTFAQYSIKQFNFNVYY